MAKDHKAQEERIRHRKQRERSNLFARLPAVYAASRAQGQKLLAQGGALSIVEWRVLWDLHSVGPMSIRDLAELQRMDPSLLSRALPAMRTKGLVTTARDPEDGRQTLVHAAPAGTEAYERAAPIMARRRAALRQEFSEDEIDTFIELIDRLESFLRQPTDDILNEEKAE